VTTGRPTSYKSSMVESDIAHAINGRSGIYALKEAGNSAVRYVGRSIDIGKRINQHKSSKSNLPSSRWVRARLRSGKKIEVVVLEYHERPEVVEEVWISKFRALGEADLNLHAGGIGVAMNGAGRCEGVWSVDGVASPFHVLIKVLWRYQRTQAAKDVAKYWKKKWSSAKTEQEKILVQLYCFQAVQNLGTEDMIIQVERWAMKASSAINAKYPNMVSVVYADGVEVTP
jgi:hypothetical protein